MLIKQEEKTGGTQNEEVRTILGGVLGLEGTQNEEVDPSKVAVVKTSSIPSVAASVVQVVQVVKEKKQRRRRRSRQEMEEFRRKLLEDKLNGGGTAGKRRRKNTSDPNNNTTTKTTANTTAVEVIKQQQVKVNPFSTATLSSSVVLAGSSISHSISISNEEKMKLQPIEEDVAKFESERDKHVVRKLGGGSFYTATIIFHGRCKFLGYFSTRRQANDAFAAAYQYRYAVLSDPKNKVKFKGKITRDVKLSGSIITCSIIVVLLLSLLS